MGGFLKSEKMGEHFTPFAKIPYFWENNKRWFIHTMPIMLYLPITVVRVALNHQKKRGTAEKPYHFLVRFLFFKVGVALVRLFLEILQKNSGGGV